MAGNGVIATEAMVDIPKIKPDQFLRALGTEFLRKEPRQLRPVMLWGAPGIGKSDCVRQLMEYVAHEKGKRSIMNDIRLSRFNPTDLKGIPCPNLDRTATTWLRPDFFDMDPDNNVVNFLFFDEMSYASQSTSQACLEILLDRRIGKHILPDNCYIFCAGNRVSDKSGAQKMIKPTANRIRHFEMVPNLKSFKIWALRQPGFDMRVISFLNFRENLLFVYDPSSDNVAFPTPRSWKAVSDTTYSMEIGDVFSLIAGDIGESTAMEFAAYCRLFEKLPNVDDIVAGKNVPAPTEPDITYALCGSLVSRINEISVTGTSDEIATGQAQVRNILLYIMKLAVEFQWATFYDIWKLPNVTPKVGTCQEFIDWARANRSHLA